MTELRDTRIIRIISRAVVFVIALVMAIYGLTGCAKSKKDNGKIKIVCTIFPEYDWIREIIKGNEDIFDVTMLMANGADLHNFQPTADDIMRISDADIFIYVGGESDKWVADALKEAKNKKMIVMNLMDVLGDRLREEELVEGMEGEEEEEDEEEEEGPEYDEHVWLSVKNAEIFVKAIEERIASLDKNETRVKKYKENADNYIAKLDELDKKYEAAVEGALFDTVVFGDRFPFRYLVDDYNLNYYAAFIGCSAETEASFKTVTFLAEKVDKLGIDSVMVIETSDQKIAKTIIDNTKTKDQKILVLDSMQAVTAKEADSGKNYYDIMEDNLNILVDALN